MALAQQMHLRTVTHSAATCNYVSCRPCICLPATRVTGSLHKAISNEQRSAPRPLKAAASAAAAAAPSTTDIAEAMGGVMPSSLSSDVTDILLYSMNLAWTAETYEVHSWMVLLGILRYEHSAAAQILNQLGIQDLYGAWHEVLWALNASDGLKARAFTPKLRFAYKARKIVDGSITFAKFAGRDIVKSEDLLLALSAGGVLEHLFPDVDLSFDTVKISIEQNTGIKYDLPDYKAPAKPAAEKDMFL